MNSFGLSCDDITWRLIQSIPRGMRSKVVREAVKMHAPQIQELRNGFWRIELEKKKAEKEYQLRVEIERKKRLIEYEKEREQFLIRKEKRKKELEYIAMAEFEHFNQRLSNSDVLVETSGDMSS